MATITCTYSIHAKHNPDRIAIQTEEQAISYREWNERIYQTADWFHSRCSTKKTVGILMPNGIPFIQIFAGASAAGWIAVPLDRKWKTEELQKRIALCSPDIIITTSSLARKVSNVCNHVVIGEHILEGISQISTSTKREVNSTVPFFMGFTSGSTGEPKAFIRNHQSWIASFECNKFDFQIDEHDYVLVPGSLLYTHFLYGVISTLYLGGTVYLLEKFSPFRTISVLQLHPITVVYVVPTMVEALLNEPTIVEKTVTFISSGAKWEAGSKQRIRNKFPNLCMYEYYGAGELSFVTMLSDQENRKKPNSVGKACYQVEIQIRNANQTIAAPYEMGKIYIRSGLVIMGYLNDGNIRSITDHDGWCTVDDMGYMDEEGYLYIVGREKSMILYGGINIFPEEIEAVLMQHPNVEAVVIVGVTDPYWGQVVTAVVQGNATKMELKSLCMEKLAPYKVPRKWHFMDKIPLTNGGKIARPQVKELLERKVHPYS